MTQTMNGAPFEIRPLVAGDASALLEIYNHYVLNTPITFDIEPRTPGQWQDWMAGFAASGRYRCFVALKDGKAVGWASASQFRTRAAYDTSVETTVYVAPGLGGSGIGRRLYTHLFEALDHEDIHRAFAAITVPNPASIRLHEVFGFRQMGIYPEVGRKFGAYHDVAIYWRPVPLHSADA